VKKSKITNYDDLGEVTPYSYSHNGEI